MLRCLAKGQKASEINVQDFDPEIREITIEQLNELNSLLMTKVDSYNRNKSKYRNEYQFIIDFDNTIILQQDNSKAEIMLTSESEELAGLMKVCFDGSTNIPERVLDKLIGTMEERSEAISYGQFAEGKMQAPKRVQYGILNFFNQLMDLVNEKKTIGKLIVLTNSSYYLIFFHLFVTANFSYFFSDKSKREPCAIASLYKSGLLQVFSCNHSQNTIRKQLTFKNLCVKFLESCSQDAFCQPTIYSIGDGIDQLQAAEHAQQEFPSLNIEILQIDYSSANPQPTFPECLQFHMAVSNLIDKQIPSDSELQATMVF